MEIELENELKDIAITRYELESASMDKIKKGETIFHPLLIGIYPVLALYLVNIEETPLFSISRSLIFSLIIIFTIYLLFLVVFTRWGIVIRSKKNLALLGFAVLLGLVYPIIYPLMKDASIANIPIGKHRFLIPLWGALFMGILLINVGIKNLPTYLAEIIDWEKAALATSLLLILFFMYGHVFNFYLFNPGKGNKFNFSQYQYLFNIFSGMFVAGMALIIFSKSTRAMNRWLNVVATILVSMVAVQLGYFFISGAIDKYTASRVIINPISVGSAAAVKRDVYFIVIDAYSREDVLRDDMNLDTSTFINALKTMGFVVPACSNSNYFVTTLSMTSTLNMDYLDQLDFPESKKGCILEGCVKQGGFTPYIHHSLVRQKFEELGYSTVTFKVVNPYLDISDSTYYYDFSKDTASINKTETVFFYYLFLQTTALRPYLDYLDWQGVLHPNQPSKAHEWIPVGSAFTDRNYNQYKLTLYNLDALEKTPELPGNKFVYAHLIITHEPFVFTPNGDFRYPVTGDTQAYLDQVRFADNKMIKILQTIIEKSKIPPIIVLQGDHGWPWGPTRTHNLSAFYLPDQGNRLIYPEITNVNTFRIIFNEYFGESYSLLPDNTFFTTSIARHTVSAAPSVCQ